jgi:hypothetical protein
MGVADPMLTSKEVAEDLRCSNRNHDGKGVGIVAEDFGEDRLQLCSPQYDPGVLEISEQHPV